MVIEHSFVTTMPAKDALTIASEFLSHGGFVSEITGASGLQEADWTRLQMRRGKKQSARAKDPTQCPQRIAMQWDRGRVTVAAAIEMRSQSKVLFGTASRKMMRKAKDHTDLMILITQSLDDLLTKREPAEIASGPWFAFQETLQKEARRRRIRSGIIVGLFTLVMVVLVVLAVNSGSHH